MRMFPPSALLLLRVTRHITNKEAARPSDREGDREQNNKSEKEPFLFRGVTPREIFTSEAITPTE